MNKSRARRLAENEMMFRQENERAQKFIQKQNLQKGEKETSLHFYCECPNEHCHDRIVMAPSKYQKLHANHNQFIVIPGHEILDIEQILIKESGYTVVEKFIKLPKTAPKLSTI